MIRPSLALASVIVLGYAFGASTNTVIPVVAADSAGDHPSRRLTGRQLFESETFGGNGRTCRTCHSRETGTVSPADATERFARDPEDPLFRADGSDDGEGHGVDRMLTEATILMRVPLAPNVSLASDPAARTVVVRRGIPTTLNTPALDPVLMYDGRQPNLASQALGAIIDHANATQLPTAAELELIADFRRRRASSARARSASSRAPERHLHCRRAKPLQNGAAASFSRTGRSMDRPSRACVRSVTAVRC